MSKVKQFVLLSDLGLPSRVEIVEQPPTTVVEGQAFATNVSVRVYDAAGLPLPGEHVEARIVTEDGVTTSYNLGPHTRSALR